MNKLTPDQQLRQLSFAAEMYKTGEKEVCQEAEDIQRIIEDCRLELAVGISNLNCFIEKVGKVKDRITVLAKKAQP